MPLLDDTEITRRLEGGDWRREGDALVRDLRFDDFAAAIAHVGRVADVAERRNHHPDILVHGYNRVRLTVSTHSEGGITDADFGLVEELDAL